jgi:predicted nucleotidyltransferase
MDRISERRRTEREREARALADTALRALCHAGVSARLVGSLARGGFGLHSDVDFVLDLPSGSPDASRALTVLSDAMGGFPYSVVFSPDLPPGLAVSLAASP